MSKEEIFKLNNVTKTYGKTQALSSLSFSVKKGETIALIGPSGAGKTTLLNLLANLIKLDEGELLIDGLDISEYKNNKKFACKVGVIRQQFDLIDQLQVIHNVLAGRLVEWGTFKSLLSLLIPQDKDLALDALKRVGLTDKAYEKTSTLSGGEQQRVALARLLVQNPKVILADEPVSSLDPARSRDVLSMLIKLVKEENQTLITSIHSVEYAREYFDRIIAMRKGKIYFDLPSYKVTDEELSKLYNITDGVIYE